MLADMHKTREALLQAAALAALPAVIAKYAHSFEAQAGSALPLDDEATNVSAAAWEYAKAFVAGGLPPSGDNA